MFKIENACWGSSQSFLGTTSDSSWVEGSTQAPTPCNAAPRSLGPDPNHSQDDSIPHPSLTPSQTPSQTQSSLLMMMLFALKLVVQVLFVLVPVSLLVVLFGKQFLIQLLLLLLSFLVDDI